MFRSTKLKLGHMWEGNGVKGYKVVFRGLKASEVHIDVKSKKTLFAKLLKRGGIKSELRFGAALH